MPYAEGFWTVFPNPIPLSLLTSSTLERYQRSRPRSVKKSTVKSEFIKIRALCRWLQEKGCLAENPCAQLASIKAFDDVQPDHLTEGEIVRSRGDLGYVPKNGGNREYRSPSYSFPQLL